MIKYQKKTLNNGLTVLINSDCSTPMAAVNIIYKVGARNESPTRTGFAHLFEHLMFGGSDNVPEFDTPVQLAAGENNAYTNNDYTDYYITLPKTNIETALWLESDRMRGLNVNIDTLELQKKVVVEEFNQRYLNAPYGDLWLILRPLIYKVHPYRWSTIGVTPDHIKEASLDDVRNFYDRYYNPSNAIIAISGDFEAEEGFALVEKWFGDIEPGIAVSDSIPQEPAQTVAIRETVYRDVPASMVYITFRMCNRTNSDFYVCDVISDLLSGGTSSRMYRELVKKKRLLTNVNAYITGDVDDGLFVVYGTPSEGVDTDVAEAAMLAELERIKNETIEERELQKVKNKFEVNTIFGELNVMNKAINLCFYEMLGDIELVNSEIDRYKSVSNDDIHRVASKIFVSTNSTTLHYIKESK